MEITDVRVRVFRRDLGKLKGVASVVFDNAFVVHDIKIIETENDSFIVMPSTKSPDGSFRDIAHPINSDLRAVLRSAILTEYEKQKSVEI